MYTCAQCTLQSCGKREPDRIPANCPMHAASVQEAAFARYALPENHNFYVTASEIEALGYCQWTRVQDTLSLIKRMDYRRVGIAFCRGLRREAKILDDILRRNGINPISVICKTGGRPKESAGIPQAHKIHPEAFEPMCNPIAQAMLLNQQKTQFNIAVGLCVGHDSMFYKYSDAPVTTLIAKDRVLAHNPAGALYCAEGYFKDKLDPR